MNELVAERVERLKSRPFVELAALPPYRVERVRLGNAQITLTTWKDASDSGDLRIVVQGYRHVLVGIGMMTAKGFMISSGGSVRELSRSEILEYI